MTSIEEEKEAAVKRAEDAERRAVEAEQRLQKALILENFECSLCLNLLLDPVSVTCGHTFCRKCINRSFEYRNHCPLCRKPVPAGVGVNVLLANIIAEIFPHDLALRKQAPDEELTQAVEAPIINPLQELPSETEQGWELIPIAADNVVYQHKIYEATCDYSGVELDETGTDVEGGYAVLRIGDQVRFDVNMTTDYPEIYAGNQFSQYPDPGYSYGKNLSTGELVWIPFAILRRID